MFVEAHGAATRKAIFSCHSLPYLRRTVTSVDPITSSDDDRKVTIQYLLKLGNALGYDGEEVGYIDLVNCRSSGVIRTLAVCLKSRSPNITAQHPALIFEKIF